MPYKFDESYELSYSAKGIVLCNVKNRDILVNKVLELENIMKMNKALNDEENNTCPVCMEPFTNGVVVLKCSHKFCPSCYASHARVDNRCALCRDEFADKPKKIESMPKEVRDSIVNNLFENTPNGEIEYFKQMATGIKMKSLDEAVKSLQYLTKENCKLSCKGVIKWYGKMT